MRNVSPLQPRQTPNETGSALLIVFVFAAIIAIMLYRELPSVTLEAERQREQQLQDRGQEYVRAVQLFYRKNQRYPGSMEALEDTNRIRYLRQRFKDPLTGKDDWRLLHAGPGGTLIDSKLNRIPQVGQMGPNGTAAGSAGTTNSNGSSFGSNTSSSFGGSSFGQNTSSSFGSSSNSNNTPGSSANTSNTGTDGSTFGAGGAFANSSFSSDSGPTVTSLYRKRPPAIATADAPPATGNGGVPSSPGTPSSADLAADPSLPLVGQNTGMNTGGPNGQNASGMESNSNNAGNTGAGTAAMQAVGNLLANGAAPQNANTSSGLNATLGSNSSTGGQLNSGGIAGVASKAKGKTLKKVADQTDFSLWEFYYDPNQDTSMRAAGSSGPAGGAINQNPNGTTSTTGQGTGGASGWFTPAAGPNTNPTNNSANNSNNPNNPQPAPAPNQDNSNNNGTGAPAPTPAPQQP